MRAAQDDLLGSLRRYFGHTAFRDGQQELVETVLAGQDLLAVMPTGSGKSLGFQLPALLLPGTTLVVSPLISLMKDQVDELNRRGIRAAALHSALSSDARRDALQQARTGECQLLYVAPERFASDYFLRTLQDISISRFVIDEAHCVSEWGHDFRPDYRRLKEAAGVCRRSDGRAGRPPMAAFTATATPEVREDIVLLLGLDAPRVVVAGFDRPNISLSVRPVSGDIEKHQLLPQLIGSGRALVYAATRKKAEAAAETLMAAGIDAAAYHAGLVDTERSGVQERFAAGSLRIVCATNAFGMGIDRPDVETVVHLDIPGSLEAYYQEIGRAGRDGRQATATLLWNYVDVRTREFLIDRENEEDAEREARRPDPAEVGRRKELDHKKLRRMVSYADTSACLRATILRYFGDAAAKEPCGSCGNCGRLQPIGDDDRLLVRKILSGVARAGERYGRRKIAAMLAGEVADLPEVLVGLSTTGLLREMPVAMVERWIDVATAAGLLSASDDKYRTLSLTTLGRDVMTGRVQDVLIAAPREKPAPSTRKKSRKTRVDAAPSALEPQQPIVEALRAWRLDEARRNAIAPFVVLHDRTLIAIASELPGSPGELSSIPGIGPAKLASYGDAILNIVKGSR
ncbi:MAG TPA: ATP-dependent DNA helicase RecQ [Vicinamibacterales bacterium]|nr:ATP-dependent DNA helicase RecQ [Vicinamibacterales bacterium]